jgi:hypothetical protein
VFKVSFARLRRVSQCVNPGSRADASEKVSYRPYDSAGAQRWTREFVKVLDNLAAPFLRQSDNGTREHKPAKIANGAPGRAGFAGTAFSLDSTRDF